MSEKSKVENIETNTMESKRALVSDIENRYLSTEIKPIGGLFRDVVAYFDHNHLPLSKEIQDTVKELNHTNTEMKSRVPQNIHSTV